MLHRFYVVFQLFITAVSTDMASWYTKNLEKYHSDDFEKLDGVLRQNALELLPRLRRA
jgi:hypothetical protein